MAEVLTETRGTTHLVVFIRQRMFHYSRLLRLAQTAVSLVFTYSSIGAAFRGADIYLLFHESTALCVSRTSIYAFPIETFTLRH